MRSGLQFALSRLVLAGVLMLPLTVQAQQEQTDAGSPDPIEIDKVEKEDVRLLLIDAIVLDRKGRTIGDLTLEDFHVSYAGDLRRPADTLDVRCSEDAQEDPRGARPSKRGAASAVEYGRRIVIALDYLHLPRFARSDVLDQARSMIRHGAAPGDEFMLVALNGGLRVEQAFTADHDEVMMALQRMEYDITLWQPDFSHQSEAMFVEPMMALLEVLGAVEGTKAVVLYSSMTDIPLDSQFADIAAVAAASRSTIYPVDCRGLVVPLTKSGISASRTEALSSDPGTLVEAAPG